MDKLASLTRRRKASGDDVAEFLHLTRRAEELFLSDADLSDGAELFQPIAERVREGLTVSDLRKLIFEVCNLLEESPLKLFIAKQKLESKTGLSDDDVEALECANWSLDYVKKDERQAIVLKLRKLMTQIQQ